MKKITIIFLIITTILAVPVIATEGENNITSSIELTQENQEVTATILINNLNATGTKAISGKIKFDATVLEYIKNEFAGAWNGAVSDDGTSFTVYTSQDENINKIVTLKFKIKSDAKVDNTKISIDNISIALEEGNGEPENEIKIQGDSKTMQIEKTKNNTTQIIAIAGTAITAIIAVFVAIYLINRKNKKAE